MAKDTKFGTFGGVFTPSILTILGVIMYLRLPWVVGTSGLYAALALIGVAHVVSVSTGLSISSIATDKKVGAGGPYYIISRSLGLPIGGTLGLALFVGLSFSISLYIIGFSESFLAYFGLPVTPTAIRICGTATIVGLTIVTFISTALAIKSQYLIMALIVASLVSIFAGSPPSDPAGPALTPAPDGASMALVFGILFPAVTGFTAGVNMSGDLRDPKKSIPRGTILAILAGLLVYVSLAIFFALRVPRALLVSDPEVLLKIALSPQAVVGGIWGATLSSALGCILGAPRILQAVAGDRVMPRWLAKGYGPSSEPRHALLVAFMLGEAGILIAELDVIARVVSMVFLATYGVLNISCAIESWVSPDFRPAFRIPRTVSVVGAVACVLLMIQLDLPAMLAATAVLGGLFFFLSRKQLTLDAGDAWEGVWSSLVRSGLWRLSRGERQQRNWRPNILAFRPPDEAVEKRLRSVAQIFLSSSGVLTDIELSDAVDRPLEREDESEVGVFRARLPADDVYRTIADVCRYHGFSGLHPNTVLLDWEGFRNHPDRFGELLDVVTQLDHNVLLAAEGTASETRARRVDVWWSPGAGNATLATALSRFFTRVPPYSQAELRFLLLSNDSASNDHLRAVMRGLLTEARIQATIRIVSGALRSETLLEHVVRESNDAELVVLGLPNDPDQCGPRYQREIEALLEKLAGKLLLVRASSGFDEVLRLSRQATISFLPPSRDGSTPEQPDIVLPELGELSTATSRLADGYQRLVSRLHKAGVQRMYGREVKLVRQIRAAVEKHFAALDRGLVGANPRRLRNLVNRTQSSLLKDFQQLLEDFADQGIDAQRGVLEGRVTAFLEARTVVHEDGARGTMTIRRPWQDFAPRDDDPPHIARLKARRRFWASRGAQIAMTVPVGRLMAFHFEDAIDKVLLTTLRQMVTDSHNLVIALGKTLSSPRMGLVLPGDDAMPDEQQLAEIIGRQRDDLMAKLDELVDHHKQRIGRHQWAMLAASRAVVQRFADDVDRLDVARHAKRRRRIDKGAAAGRRQELTDLISRWHEHQKLVVERARLGLRLSTFQHRLVSAVQREKQAIVLGIRSGTLGECEQFLAGLKGLAKQLAAYSEEDDSTPLVIAFDTRADLEQRFDAERVIDNLVTGTADLAGDLPQSVTTLSDEAMKRLEEGRSEEVETVEVPVMRLAQFLVEARFVGVVQSAIEKIPRLEARAAGVAQDAVRLVSFQLSELGASDEGATAPLAEQLGPVVASGIERLESEIATLVRALEEVSTTVDDQLEVVIDGTNPYDLTATAAQLAQHVRRHQGEKAAAGARSLLRRGAERVNQSLVRMVYNKSSGLLMARELRARAVMQGQLVDRVRELVEQHMPRPEVLEQLPSYYRQLFYGQAAITESFWVGRDKQLADARRAIAAFGRGSSGALVVVGERGSGKTSLVQRIAGELLSRRAIYRVMPPRHGAPVGVKALEPALQKAVGGEGSAEELLSRLVDDPVVILDDLELWWERSEEGLETVEAIVSLLERFGDRILFVIATSSQAFSFLNRIHPLSDAALAVLECGPVNAESLRSIVMLRHGSTGLTFELDGKSEEQLSDLRLARLFSGHFDYAGGHLGAALRSWITHVRKVSGSQLIVERPSTERWELLDELRPPHRALLVQLVLHKALSREGLERVTGMQNGELSHDVETLIRMGLLTESRQKALSINPFVHHAVVNRLRHGGLLT